MDVLLFVVGVLGVLLGVASVGAGVFTMENWKWTRNAAFLLVMGGVFVGSGSTCAILSA